MANNLFILNNVSDFSPGAFEDTSVENGTIQLGRTAEGYLLKGSYTSPAFNLKPFYHLIPSWNTDTPPGTSIDFQVRVFRGREWSAWISFGEWSPFIKRHAAQSQKFGFITRQWDTLTVSQIQSAKKAQIRVHLYTTDQTLSPKVRLLAVSVKETKRPEEEYIECIKELEVPTYACLNRDPKIAPLIANATALTMLLNRWGEDVLPEEVAHIVYDYTLNRYDNKTFLAASGGVYNFECYSTFASINQLKKEIKNNHAVAVQMDFSSSDRNIENPIYYVILRGFKIDEETQEEMVILNDPLCPSDTEVRKEVLLSDFLAYYTDLALFFHKTDKKNNAAKPKYNAFKPIFDENQVSFQVGNKSFSLAPFKNTKSNAGTLCYTISDDVAYSSAAQKIFYYPDISHLSSIFFDTQLTQNKKVTFYAINAFGEVWVGEKNFVEFNNF